jgi:peroxiredoxin
MHSSQRNDAVAVLFEGRPPAAGAARPDGDALWIGETALEAATGWALKPEGMCRGEACVPLAPGATAGGEVDLAAFARRLGQPVVRDDGGRAWAFGTRVAADGAASTTAPDFALPDLDGRIHTLAEHRGKKVVLYAWATWCSCRWHLPEWQALYEELSGEGLIVIAVATDGSGAPAAEPFIRAAAPTHPSLIDEHHVVTELYGLVNVPNTVWIDERGRIVRAVEAAGMIDVTGAMDRETLSLSEETLAAEQRGRGDYLDAVRAWVRTGAGARAPREPQDPLTLDKATALAHHRLGAYLVGTGDLDAAAPHFSAALRLDPKPWTLRRDAWGLRNRVLEGDAMMSPDSPLWAEFWTALDAADGRFYEPTDLSTGG